MPKDNRRSRNRQNERLTCEELLAYCKERLTGYKRPRIVAFVKSLPKSDVGKVLGISGTFGNNEIQ